MEQFTTAEIKKIIRGQPTSVISQIIDEYIHDERNREIAKRKLLLNEPYEPLSERYAITPRQCFNVVTNACRVIMQHIET